MDQITRYLAADGAVRIILAETREACEQARLTHGASPVATAALGRVLTATAMLASEMKAEGSVTVTIDGGGPMGRLCAVARPDGSVKAYAGDPAVELPLRADGKLDVGGAVGRTGRLTVVRDLGLREPYVGMVNLVSGEIAVDFAQYLTASEQQNSLVALGVLVDTDYTVAAAGGVIVQPLPGCPESVLQALELRAPLLGDISRSLHGQSGDAFVRAVFEGMNPEAAGSTPVHFRCDCSRERVEAALIAMGGEELRDMARQDGGAQVCCHFCNTQYQFTARELEQMAG